MERSRTTQECERRFVVLEPALERLRKGPPTYVQQGYFPSAPDSIVRVNVVDATRALITIKLGMGENRRKIEHSVELNLGKGLLEASKWRLSKNRYDVARWEASLYRDHLSGLVIVEYELRADETRFPYPSSDFGQHIIEVTDAIDNAKLAALPVDFNFGTSRPIAEAVLDHFGVRF